MKFICTKIRAILKIGLLLVLVISTVQVINAEDSPQAFSSATASVEPSEQEIEDTSSTSHTYEITIKPSAVTYPSNPIPPICFDFVDYVKKYNAIETYRLTGTFFDPDNPDKTFSEPGYEKITHDQGNWDLLLSLELQEMLIQHNTENAERMATQDRRGEAIPYQPFGSYYLGDGEWSEYYQMKNPYTLSPQERIQGSEDYLIERLKGIAKAYARRGSQLYRTVVDYNNDGIDETLIFHSFPSAIDCKRCYVNEMVFLVDKNNNLEQRFYNHGQASFSPGRPFFYQDKVWYIVVSGKDSYPNWISISQIQPPNVYPSARPLFSIKFCAINVLH